MRIIHVIDSIGLYGAEVVLLNLMEYQKRADCYPVLISLGNSLEREKPIEAGARECGIEVIPLRFKSTHVIDGALELTRMINDCHADVVHSHGYKGNMLLGLFARRKLKVPVLTTLHGWTSTKLVSKLSIYKLLDVLAIKRLDDVVSVSSAICCDRLLQLFRLHPHIISNGIPALDFQTSDVKEMCQKMFIPFTGAFNIISIGRLSPEKGFDVLIRAVQKLIAGSTNSNLVIVGEGEEKASLLHIARDINIADKVFLIGQQDRAYKFIPYFDVFVISSYTEGLPISLLEAMQAGVPIVATCVGEIPRVLENGKLGHLVSPGDTEALARAITKVYEDRGRAIRTATLAQRKALHDYTLENMSESYFEVYNRIINKRKKPHNGGKQGTKRIIYV